MENSEKSAKYSKNQKIYSANELCNIIKTCSKNGVSNLKISGIEIDFSTKETPKLDSWVKPTTTYKTNKKLLSNDPLAPLDLTDNDLEELEELERAQQAIDDPVGFEDRILKEFTLDNEGINEANGYS